MFFKLRFSPNFFKLQKALLWTLLSGLVGIATGTMSALFLTLLEHFTHQRELNSTLIYFLPAAGLVIVFFYQRFGRSVDAGTNLLLEEIHEPKKTTPLRMTPLVLAGTLLTHLFGGSAGREGTAVQMGGSIADQVNHYLKLPNEDRKILLMAGIAGGFASVFGTPLAGAIFGLEVLSVGKIKYEALLPCVLTALIAHFTCLQWGVAHTAYPLVLLPAASISSWLFVIFSGALFGLCAALFAWGSHRMTDFLKTIFSNPYVRVFAGGTAVVLLTLALGTQRYLGLGIPTIVASFQTPAFGYDFILKIIFTVITLSCGFKGGEVTPLFFIGATLGSALALLLPLPVSLLAAMGFVAVFAGAANTPLACILMAIELFGADAGLYIALAVVVSYLCSGHRGIYPSQKIEVRKYA